MNRRTGAIASNRTAPDIRQRQPVLPTVLTDVTDLKAGHRPLDDDTQRGRKHRHVKHSRRPNSIDAHDTPTNVNADKSHDMITWTPTSSPGQDSRSPVRLNMAGRRTSDLCVAKLRWTL